MNKNIRRISKPTTKNLKVNTRTMTQSCKTKETEDEKINSDQFTTKFKVISTKQNASKYTTTPKIHLKLNYHQIRSIDIGIKFISSQQQKNNTQNKPISLKPKTNGMHKSHSFFCNNTKFNKEKKEIEIDDSFSFYLREDAPFSKNSLPKDYVDYLKEFFSDFDDEFSTIN